MSALNNVQLYHSQSEKQMCWAFARASRRVDLDIRLCAVPHEYKFWLYVALPENADAKAQEQFTSICNELKTGYEYSTLQALTSGADKREAAQKIFNIAGLA